MVKILFGSNVRSFLNSCLMSVSTEEVLTKSMKKIVSKTVLFCTRERLRTIAGHAVLSTTLIRAVCLPYMIDF